MQLPACLTLTALTAPPTHTWQVRQQFFPSKQRSEWRHSAYVGNITCNSARDLVAACRQLQQQHTHAGGAGGAGSGAGGGGLSSLACGGDEGDAAMSVDSWTPWHGLSRPQQRAFLVAWGGKCLSEGVRVGELPIASEVRPCTAPGRDAHCPTT